MVLLMTIPFVSCKKDVEDDTVNTNSDTSVEYPDYEGYEFRVLTEKSGWQHYAFDCAEYSGDPVDKALYTRNRTMESDYNIAILETNVETGTAATEIKNDILSQTYTYDLMFSFANHTYQLCAEGIYNDLNDIPELNLTASCWDQGSVRDLSVANRLFCVTGDIHFGAFDAVSILMYNRDMAEELKLDDARELALSGKWTMEELGKMIKAVAADLDNDSEYLDPDDRFGISSTTAIWTNLMIGGGVSFFEKNKEDVPEYAGDSSKFSDVYSKMMSIVSSTSCYVPNGNVADDASKVKGDTYRDVFNSGHALFMGGLMADLDNVKARDSGINYSPMPLPKYDTDQTSYTSSVNFQGEVMYMPVGKDTVRTATITQALCERSTDTLRASYYEQCLKTQRVDESEDAELLDIIYDSRVYDIGLISLWGNIRATFNGELAGKYLTAGLGSFNQMYGKSADNECKNFVKLIKELD